MSGDFASGKHAYGYCDRCQQRYDYHELKTEFVQGNPMNNRVCPECWDEDHPQNFLFRVDPNDPISLEDPRPPLGEAESRKLWSWAPVGTQTTSTVWVGLGKITVSTS